jgi:hypothetical protein
MALEVKGTLVSSDGGERDFSGWTVVFSRRAEDGSPAGRDTRATADSAGRFSASLPETFLTSEGDIAVVVKPAQGESVTIAMDRRTLRANAERLSLTVPAEASPLPEPQPDSRRRPGSDSEPQPAPGPKLVSDPGPGLIADPDPKPIPRLTPGGRPPPPVLSPVRGMIIAADARPADFTGYRVVISYTAAVTDPTTVVLTSAEKNVTLGDMPGFELTVAQEKGVTLTDPHRFETSLPSLARDSALGIVALYPDGSRAAGDTFSADEAAAGVVLEVPLRLPPAITLDEEVELEAAYPSRIRGKVIDASGARRIAAEQVILWGSVAEGQAATPVLLAVTDANGNFAGDYPRGRFKAAFGTVSNTRNARLEAGVPINLGVPNGRFPEFVYLVVDLSSSYGTGDAEDCACDGEPPRQPDQEDLIKNSSTYSQDIGASCVNFTTPNRTLEEFSYSMAVRTTEPSIKGTTLSDHDQRLLYAEAMTAVPSARTLLRDAGLASGSAAPEVATRARGIGAPAEDTPTLADISPDMIANRAAATTLVQGAFKTVGGRGELSVRNSVDWDSTPTFYQATSIAHGHILHFKQVWKADGYSMGDLLYSLPLAPGQKKNIVVFDWDRSESASRSETFSEDEALNSYLSHNRDINDVVHASAHEHTHAHSDSKTGGKAGGIGGGIGAKFGKVFLGVSGGYSASSGSASTNAWQESSRNISGTALNQLRDSVLQGASAVRNQRATVVQTARQAERFSVQTETVANYNHCHAITVQYFEILRHYAITQELTQVQECLFVPLLMSPFNEPKVLRWADILRASLIAGTDTLPFLRAGGRYASRRYSLADGFAAIERRQANYAGSDLPAGRYADEMLTDLWGDLTITLSLNRPQDKDDGAIDPALWAIFLHLRGWQAQWVFNTWLAGRKPADRDKVFDEEVAPQLAEGFVDTLKVGAIDKDGRFHDLKLDLTLLTRYERGAPLHVTIRPPMQAFSVRRSDIEKIVIYTNFDLSKSANSRIVVRGGSMSYRTAHFSGTLFIDTAINNDLKNVTIAATNVTIPTDNVVIHTPLTTEEMRDPREEDKEKATKLLTHLNAHLEYYHKRLWLAMDPDRRYMLLDGFQAPNSGGKSVASVVENRVLGVAGNCLIMPVAPGYKLDPTYTVEPVLDADGKPALDEAGKPILKETDLLAHYRPRTPVPPYRVSLPTRGVFAESVSGACNSCEKIDNSRFWRWEESPIPDSPTQIMPIQTAPPQRSDPGDLNPTPFPTPMINIQNAPAAPDPGAGLTGAFGVLGKSDLFRDLTGVEGTQNNALRAMLSNQETARHFADKAAQLAIQASATKHGASNIDQIKEAMADGSIDKETGRKLIADQLKAQIDGGKGDPPAGTAGSSRLADVTADAIKSGKAVQATQTFPDGTSATLKQDTPAEDESSDAIDFTVPGTVTPLKQPSPDTCWAAVTAMLTGWRSADDTPPTVAGEIARIGSPYTGYLQQDVPLAATDKNALITKLGMVADPIGLASAEPSAYLDLLSTYGPLWATVDGDETAAVSAHAKLIYGLRGDGSAKGTVLRIVDPVSGTKVEQTFSDFAREFDDLVKDAPADKPLSPRIVRFAAKLTGEGASAPTVFDGLTAIARGASMGLSANGALRLKPVSTAGGSFTVDHHHSEGWSGKTVADANGLETSDLRYPIPHGNHVMAMQVVDRMAWDQTRVTLSGKAYSLPLKLPFLLAADSSDANLPMKSSSPVFPLQGTIQSRATLLYGYMIDTADSSVSPIDLSVVDPDDVEGWLKSAGGSATKRAVLVVYDFTAMAPSDDFQPKMGAPMGPAYVARFYPLLSVWTGTGADEAASVLWLLRPTTSPMADHDPAMGSVIRTSFYTDHNDDMKTMWEDLAPAVRIALQLVASSGLVTPLQLLNIPQAVSKGLTAAAAQTAILALKLLRTVRWESIFAYYKLGTSLDSTVMVDRGKALRTNSSDRHKMDSASRAYVATKVTKVPGQGTFDNVHIAPDMIYQGAVAAMAPICQHDCLHMHWRWGLNFTDTPVRGWSGGLPYAAAGAPMIPENQNLAMESSNSSIRYKPAAKGVPAAKWQIFCHHGLAYATKLTLVGHLTPLLELTALDVPLDWPSWEGLYYHNRFWETGGSNRAADKPRLREAKFAALQSM